MASRFTDKGIAALKPKDGRYEVWEGGSGFGVRVSTKGRKTWVWMYRFEGKARRMQFGTFPTVSLASARIKHGQALKMLELGQDPGAAAQDEKKAEREAFTVKQLVDEYLERGAKGIRSYDEVKRILEKDVVGAWGRRKANSIKRRDVILLLDSIVDRDAPVMANRTLTWARRMFNFAIGREIVETNPTAGVSKPGKETDRERTLTHDEIRGLWQGLPNADMAEAMQITTKLILTTAQRPIEVAGAKADELDLEKGRLWTIPGERTKNGRIHLVPLSTQAVDLFKDAIEKCAKGGVVFPSSAGRPLISREISKAFLANAKPLGIPEPKLPESDPRKKLTPGEERERKLALKRERKRVAFTPHDLRRTGYTAITSLGFTRFIADRVTNHTEPGVGRVYDRYEYLREKRAALEAWGQRLSDILAGKEVDDSNVVTFRPAAS